MEAKVALTTAFIISLAILGASARSSRADSTNSTPVPQATEGLQLNQNSSVVHEKVPKLQDPDLKPNLEEAITGNRTDDTTESSDTDDAVDGRSAYINNQFVPDEEIVVSQPPPLYELLQQQMEHVLAATGPEYSLYAPKEEAFQQQQQSYDNADGLSETDYEEKPQRELGNQYDFYERPTVELPKPMYRLKHAHSHNRRYVNRTKPSEAYYEKPITPPTGIQEQENKPRITYETVSSSSQFVSTPLADFMLKFSISMAKPSNLTKRLEAHRQYNSQPGKLKRYTRQIL